MAEEAMRRAESERDLSSKRQKDEEEGDAQRSRRAFFPRSCMFTLLVMVREMGS